ncbi:MAG TPA: M28 family peptidase [Candidatus Acidoferrales bacterium]|nr:M28 family peptidase [Candidatus Acidoferrales bacterium]
MRRTILSSSLLVILSLAVLFTAAAKNPSRESARKSAKSSALTKYGNADSITENEMKIYDYFLASDQLEGRNLPSRGYDTAALYVASHLAEWGLKPGGSTSGTNGPLQPYFMPIALVTREVVPNESKASLTGPSPFARPGEPAEQRTTDFEYGRDWSVQPVGGFRGLPPADPVDVTGSLIFAGNGYVINKSNTNPYQGLDVHGKIIVVAGLPAELAAAAGRRGAPNPLGEDCKDFLTPEEYAAKNGAVAVLHIADFQQLSAMTNPNTRPSYNGPTYQVAKFQQQPACPTAPSIIAGLEMTNAIFQGEKLNSQQAFYAAGTNAKHDSFELKPEKKLTLHAAIRSEEGHGENVVGILEGSDPTLKNEYVVISAHLDHIGLSAPLPNGHNVNNGADDDGSGSTGLLAIAREYAQGAAKGMRPKRSIIFLWNAGEEKGLWGSRYFNEFPPIDLTKVVADLNMDMIGRTKNPNSVDPNPTHFLVNPGEVLVVGPNISSDDLEKTIESVNDNFEKLKLNHFYDDTAPDATHDNLGPKPNGQRIFYRSDHYNFAKMGIPIAFFTVGLHVDYHRPTDTPEKIDYKEIQVVSRTVAGVAWVLATQPGRPHLKSDLPAQLVKDMKTAQTDGWGKVTPVLPPLPAEPF